LWKCNKRWRWCCWRRGRGRQTSLSCANHRHIGAHTRLHFRTVSNSYKQLETWIEQSSPSRVCKWVCECVGVWEFIFVFFFADPWQLARVLIMKIKFKIRRKQKQKQKRSSWIFDAFRITSARVRHRWGGDFSFKFQFNSN